MPLAGQQYTISTIAKSGTFDANSVPFYNPTSLALDSAGNIYVSDWSGFIRKLWIKDGALTGYTVVAGIGTHGYSGDGGQATSAMIGRGSLALDAADNLYFADVDYNRIRRIDKTGVITTVAGTGLVSNGLPADDGDGGPAINAGVRWPTGIVIDSANNLYFSSNWSRIRKVTASNGIIQTIAGQWSTGFAGDGGPALKAEFWDPVPTALDRNGDLYIADYENSRIRVLSMKTGIVNTVAGSSACILYRAPFEVTICRGSFGGDGGPAKSAALAYAAAVAVDTSGNLYIADTINHRIRRLVASTGLIYTIAGNGGTGRSGDGGPAVLAETGDPTSIVVDNLGNVYFVDEQNSCIRVLTPAAPQPLFHIHSH